MIMWRAIPHARDMFVAVFKQNLKQPISGDGDHREHADYCSQRENYLQNPNEGVLQSFHRADYSPNVALKCTGR